MDSEDLSLEELKLLRKVNALVDDLLEQALKNRENLDQTFRRLFPELLTVSGAVGVTVTSLDEELAQQTWTHGDFDGQQAGALLAASQWGTRKAGKGTFVSQELDVVGTVIGSIGLYYAGDQTARAARLERLLDTVGEELDTVLASIQTASEKHQTLMTINHFLSNRVFEAGMDAAVKALCERVKIPGFMLMYRDAVDGSALHYRVYKDGQLESASNATRSKKLDESIRVHGSKLVSPADKTLREVLGSHRAVEAVLISSFGEANALGKIMVWSGADGFSAYTMDLIRLLASSLSQRLIDYNRERIHLSQFFAPRCIDDLMRDPDYEKRYLTPRDEQVGILFADINGFTKICEQVLERPDRIGKFVDDWSEEAVRIIHAHNGVFDKMVGDCVIGLFGPPFFNTTLAERSRDATKAALEIQAFTKDKMTAHKEISKLPEILKLPGLGVAIGVNLAPTFCGLFGPNRQYTGFSTGMNQTARLQSLGSFRETLIMQSAKVAMDTLDDQALKALKYGPLTETPVKNVAQPLKHYKVL